MEGSAQVRRRPPEFYDPVPCGMSREAVWSLAEKCALSIPGIGGRELLRTHPDYDVDRAMRELGGAVVRRDFEGPRKDEYVPPSIVVHRKGRFEVRMSSLLDPGGSRYRTNIALAVGHYVLHYPLVVDACGEVPMRAPAWADETDEPHLRQALRETVWFAGGLMMPESIFRRLWDEHGGDVDRIAARFRASTGLVRGRAVSLGYELQQSASEAAPSV